MRLSNKLFLTALLPALYILTSCGTGMLEQQVQALSDREVQLSKERDSILRLVVMKTEALDARTTAYDSLNAGKTELEMKNKALQVSLNSRSSQLKTAELANADYENSIEQEKAAKDSLMKEIKILHQKIRAIDAEVDDEQKANIALTQQLEDQEERRIADSTAAASAPRPQVYKSGYINISEIGAGIGLGDTDPDFSRRVISINNVFGYGINRNFITGVGVGVNFYNGGAMIPLYLDLRYTFREKSITPFIVADGGLMISLDKFNESGVFVNPMIGIKRKLNDKFSFHLSAGGLVQHAPAGMRNSFINFKGGVSFKK